MYSRTISFTGSQDGGIAQQAGANGGSGELQQNKIV